MLDAAPLPRTLTLGGGGGGIGPTMSSSGSESIPLSIERVARFPLALGGVSDGPRALWPFKSAS